MSACVEHINITVSRAISVVPVINRPVVTVVSNTRPTYTVVNRHALQGYEWGSINIAALSTSIYSEHFKRKLGPIMYYKGAPVDWQYLEVVQQVDGNGKYTGYLDTSAWGELKGLLRYQYK